MSSPPIKLEPAGKSKAIATAASAAGNPNLISREAAEHLQRRRNSMDKKNTLAGNAQPRRFTQMQQMILDLEAGNKAAKEEREKELAKAKVQAAQAEVNTFLAAVGKTSDNQVLVPVIPITVQHNNKHDGFRLLTQSNALYIEPAGPEFEQIFELDIKHKYVVMNSLAERVFFASETLEEYCEAFSPHREVELTVFAGFGGLLFEVNGNTRKATVEIRHSNDIMERIGTVQKSRLSSTYTLYDHEKEPLFRLVRSRAAEREEVVEYGDGGTDFDEDDPPVPILGRDFDLYGSADDFVEPIGELNAHHVLIEKRHTGHRYGITFPENLEIHSKILICSALLLLNFLYFEKFEVGNRRTQACAGIIFGLMVASIILLLILIGVAWVYLSIGQPMRSDVAKEIICSDV